MMINILKLICFQILFIFILLLFPIQTEASKGEVDLATIFFEKAEKQLNQKMYDQAIENYQKAIQYAPEKYEYYQYLAYAYSVKKNFKEALTVYSKAYILDKHNPEVFYNAGVIFYELEMFDKAIDAFHMAIYLKTDFTDAYHNLGAVYYYQGYLIEAIENYQIAYQLSPNDPQIIEDLETALNSELVEINPSEASIGI